MTVAMSSPGSYEQVKAVAESGQGSTPKRGAQGEPVMCRYNVNKYRSSDVGHKAQP